MNELPIETVPKRVVSLVPSTTESLFELGFGDTVVGITDYCTQPVNEVSNIKRLGGPKNVRLQDIFQLHPDLVIANQEENSKEDVEELLKNDIPVWVTFPKTIRQSLDDLWMLTELYHRQIAVDRLRSLEVALDYARLAADEAHPVRYFCPIWEEEIRGQRWWMTFGAETYPTDLLSIFGGKNVVMDCSELISPFSQASPAEETQIRGQATRYPKFTFGEIIDAKPEVVLLPSEPYPYTYQHTIEYRKLFSQKSTGNNNISVRWLDGSLITWHGTRLGRALQELTQIFKF